MYLLHLSNFQRLKSRQKNQNYDNLTDKFIVPLVRTRSIVENSDQ